MSNSFIRWLLKPLVFLIALLPYGYMVQRFRTQDLGADPVQWLTHFTGNWALYLLLVSLAITPVRRLLPKMAWLVRFRRMLGLFAFFYATLHLAIYVFLFSGFDLPGAMASLRVQDLHAIRQQWASVWPTIVDDLKKRRFIQVGLISYVILLALAVTSPQRVMRAMGGKPWQRLHRLVYVAAVLSVVHYWWLVKKGVFAPWRDTAVLALLLLARPASRLFTKKPGRALVPARIDV